MLMNSMKVFLFYKKMNHRGSLQVLSYRVIMQPGVELGVKEWEPIVTMKVTEWHLKCPTSIDQYVFLVGLRDFVLLGFLLHFKLIQWYAELTLMCGGLLFTKKRDNRCLINNHNEAHNNAINLLWTISI